MEQSEYVCSICGKTFYNYVGREWIYQINVKRIYARIHGKIFYKHIKLCVCSYHCKREYDSKKGGLI